MRSLASTQAYHHRGNRASRFSVAPLYGAMEESVSDGPLRYCVSQANPNNTITTSSRSSFAPSSCASHR